MNENNLPERPFLPDPSAAPSAKDRSCCGVIIAAGLSSRMGAFKPLLPINGRPAIHHLIRNFQNAGIGSLVIVTGCQADVLTDACSAFPSLTFVQNRSYRTTDMFTSAKIGFRNIPADCRRVLYTPADICLVSEGLLRALAASPEPLVYPSFHYRKGHPVSLCADLLPDLLSYNGPGGLKGAFASLPVDPSYLVTEDGATLMDMDTPEEYHRMCTYAALREERSA